MLQVIMTIILCSIEQSTTPKQVLNILFTKIIQIHTSTMEPLVTGRTSNPVRTFPEVSLHVTHFSFF